MINFTRAKIKPLEEATEGDILRLTNEKLLCDDYWLICRSKDSKALREYYFKSLTKHGYKLFYPYSLGKSLPAIFRYFGTKNITIYDGSSSTVSLDEEEKQ